MFLKQHIEKENQKINEIGMIISMSISDVEIEGEIGMEKTMSISSKKTVIT